METYSVSWRLQRITVEHAYVSVPITDELICEQPDGSGRINVELMTQRALELAAQSGVDWYPEEQRLRVHPIQKAPEAEER
jgi:hypothetical protein